MPFVGVYALKEKMWGIFSLLQWYGKNTMLFMGLNYFFNTATGIVWHHMPIISQYNYNWAVKSIACVICISIMILIWNKIKDRFPTLSVVGF